MKTDDKKYTCFEYVDGQGSDGEIKNNPFQRGDVVIKPFYGDGIEPCNEIGVVLQVHDSSEVRTDMFGNESITQLRMATSLEIVNFRPKLAIDMGVGVVVLK